MIELRPVNIATLLLAFVLFSMPAMARGRLDRESPFLQKPNAKIVIPPRESDAERLLQPQRESQPVVVHGHRLRKLFWIGWGLAAGMTVANAEMVKHCEHVAGCQAASVWGTRNPSRLQLYLPDAAVITAGMLCTRSWLHEDPNDKYSKATIYGVDGIMGVSTVFNAFHPF